jgi:tripartite-type tricarboxylate transporter receptor subunit TctC
MKRTVNTLRRRFTRLALCALAGGLSMAQAQAQASYPDKPIRILLGFAPGAITDTLARTVAAQLSRSMGQPVVVENRAGAGGTLAAEAVAKAAPDGYTLLLGESGSMSINPLLMSRIPYDVERDFAPIAQAVNLPLVLVTHPGTRMQRPADLAAFSQEGKALNYGSAGQGTIQHLSVELFKAASRLPLNHVPYRGGAPALTDLLGGQIPLLVATVATVAAQVKSGKAVPLVIMGRNRSPVLPDVPTLAEAGFSALEMGNPWQGFFAPAGTPPAIVNRLNAEIRKALEVPEVREKLLGAGAEIVVSAPEEFRQALRAELAIWRRAIQLGGVKPE